MVFSGKCSIYVNTNNQMNDKDSIHGKKRQAAPTEETEELRRRLTLFRKYERGELGASKENDSSPLLVHAQEGRRSLRPDRGDRLSISSMSGRMSFSAKTAEHLLADVDAGKATAAGRSQVLDKAQVASIAK
eukprot:6232339-Prymnesium_polylepis.1